MLVVNEAGDASLSFSDRVTRRIAQNVAQAIFL
jgi:hypothetical protein